MLSKRSSAHLALAAAVSASALLFWSWRRYGGRKARDKAGVRPEDRANLDPTVKESRRVLLLSSSEQGIVNMAERSNGLMIVCLRLCLQGPSLPKSRIAKALKMLQLRHPLLRYRLERRHEEPVLVESDDTTIPLEVTPTGKYEKWQVVWKQYEKKPFGVGDPILRVVAVPREGETDLLLFFHHGFSDGKSMAAVAHDLLQYIENQRSNPVPLRFGSPLEVAVAKELPSGLFSRWGHVYKLMKAIFALVTMPKGGRFQVDKGITPQNISSKCSTVLHYITLSKEESSNLVKACRSQRTTVTGALGAALVDATAECLKGDEPIVLATAVDLRKLYTPPMSPSLLSYHVSATKMFACPVVPNRSTKQLWEVARDLRALIVESLKVGLPLTIAGLISSQYNQPPVLEHGISITLSNWGVLPFVQSYGQWTLSAVQPAANLNYISQPGILVSTANGCITVSVLAPAPIISPTDLEALASRYEVRIRRLVSS